MNDWITDRDPIEGKTIILSLVYPNRTRNRVTVGYLSKDDQEFGGTCYRDQLKNALYFDDGFIPAYIACEDVAGWMPMPQGL